MLPYSRQSISEEDIEAVAEALRSPIISQGERLASFERAFADRCGVKHAVGISSGTAALHAMFAAGGIGEGDEVIVPAITFASAANVVLLLGAKPVFADVDRTFTCLDPSDAAAKLTPRTRAVLAVDFAGVPAAYSELSDVIGDRPIILLGDAAHSVGASLNDIPVGALADLTAFSFNPIKNMTSAEGGMVTTNSDDAADRLRMFRVHGMTRDERLFENESPGGWYYEQLLLGLNYKLSELHAALGLSQLKRLDVFNQKRAKLAEVYRELLADVPVELPGVREGSISSWHLFAIRVEKDKRPAIFAGMREAGFGVQVHYIPVPAHPYYRKLGHEPADFPNAWSHYERTLSLPLHPEMETADVERVVDRLRALL